MCVMFHRALLLLCIGAVSEIDGTRYRRQLSNPFTIPDTSEGTSGIVNPLDVFNGERRGTRIDNLVNALFLDPNAPTEANPLSRSGGFGYQAVPTRTNWDMNIYAPTKYVNLPNWNLNGGFETGPEAQRFGTNWYLHPKNNFKNLSDKQMKNLVTNSMLYSAFRQYEKYGAGSQFVNPALLDPVPNAPDMRLLNRVETFNRGARIAGTN